MEKRAHSGWRVRFAVAEARRRRGDAGDGRGRKSRVTSRVRGRRKPRWYKVGEFDNAKGIAHVGGRKRGVELWSGAVLYIKHSKGCFYFGAIQCIL